MEIQQELNHKICLVGYGYWGKILHKNLTSLGYNNITIVDVVLDNFNLLDDSYTHYFVVTPFTTHHDILLKLSKFKNKRIWCEKPLVNTFQESTEIYSLMEQNNNMLFGYIRLIRVSIKSEKLYLRKKLNKSFLTELMMVPKDLTLVQFTIYHHTIYQFFIMYLVELILILLGMNFQLNRMKSLVPISVGITEVDYK